MDVLWTNEHGDNNMNPEITMNNDGRSKIVFRSTNDAATLSYYVAKALGGNSYIQNGVCFVKSSKKDNIAIIYDVLKADPVKLWKRFAKRFDSLDVNVVAKEKTDGRWLFDVNGGEIQIRHAEFTMALVRTICICAFGEIVDNVKH